jgi:hypothetical protein
MTVGTAVGVGVTVAVTVGSTVVVGRPTASLTAIVDVGVADYTATACAATLTICLLDPTTTASGVIVSAISAFQT